METSTVYPRWRGEHDSATLLRYREAGLSPLARGTLFAAPGVDLVGRFIPAGAGNTQGFSVIPGENPVYPRWRGEHKARKPHCHPAGGLSPLARGTHIFASATVLMPRFIPAGAGNTPANHLRQATRPVYPRWRGEHFYQRSIMAVMAGLSPLARGTRPLRRLKTAVLPVYPRWRGEHKTATPDLIAVPGLSPLARGTLLRVH